jgi:hypothetical protein
LGYIYAHKGEEGGGKVFGQFAVRKQLLLGIATKKLQKNREVSGNFVKKRSIFPSVKCFFLITNFLSIKYYNLVNIVFHLSVL